MRSIKNLIYLLLLAITLALGWTKWHILVISLTSSASYFPDFPFWPLWLPLGILVVAYSIYFVYGTVKKIAIDFKQHLMVLVLLGAVLLARIFGLFSASETKGFWEEQDIPPRLAMERAASRLQARVEKLRQDSGEDIFPSDAETLYEILKRNGRLPPCGFRSFGIRAPIHLVIVTDAEGPVLQVRKGDRAGTIYYGINEDASEYWITMVGLERLPAGKPAILRDSDSQPRVLTMDRDGSSDEE